MSYILDALRKADAQRERDPARGIHAQPARMATGDRRLSDGYRAGFWAATAAGLAALASVGWYLYRDSGVAPVAPPARTEVVVAVAAPASIPGPARAAPAAAVLPPTVVAPAAAVLPPPVVVALPLPAKAEPAHASRAVARPSSENSPTGAAAAQRAGLAPAPAATAAAPNAPAAAPAGARAAAAPAVADTAPPIAGLPADAPKLAISGGVYSAKAVQRMLIVNGQVFNEGGEVGPGLVLEEIRPKAAVIRFRGSRYTVAY